MRRCCNYKVVGEGEFKVTPSVTDLDLDKNGENVIITYSDGNIVSLELPKAPEAEKVDDNEIVRADKDLSGNFADFLYDAAGEGKKVAFTNDWLMTEVNGKKHYIPTLIIEE